MIEFKESKLKEEFDRAPLLLKLIVEDVAKVMRGMSKPCVITRILGKIDGDSGVHSDHRAVDIRDQYLGKYTFTEEQRQKILNEINSRYYRNDGYQTMISHSFAGGPLHFHVQVAELTKAYMPKQKG